MSESQVVERQFIPKSQLIHGCLPQKFDRGATRVTLAYLSRWFDWRSALVIVPA
jgi:hypothetical protein